MLKLTSTHFFACFLHLYLADAADHHLDLPILVPVQVLKRNNVLKLTFKKQKTQEKQIPVSAWDIFKKLVSYLVRSAKSASRGACLSLLSGNLQLCSWNKMWGSILSHKLLTGGVRIYYLSKEGGYYFSRLSCSVSGSLTQLLALFHVRAGMFQPYFALHVAIRRSIWGMQKNL